MSWCIIPLNTSDVNNYCIIPILVFYLLCRTQTSCRILDIKVIIVDNDSTDNTANIARKAALKLGLDLTIAFEQKPGKSNALNRGLRLVKTSYFIDTIIHPLAIKNIVARMLSSPNVCAVAGHVLAKNSRENILTKMQEWDYFIGIASLKRMYQY